MTDTTTDTAGGTATEATATYGGWQMDFRPWLYADVAADALRRLRHAIDDNDVEGWEYPDDGYKVIGHLITALQWVPEVLTSTDILISGAPQDAISVPGADDPAAELRALYADIVTAQEAAREAVAALGAVHARLGRLKFDRPEVAGAE
ncbi:hypothetical protein [Streptomyces niveus]|uniref:hypothetical protein n=1 Tax=Streptomyces niveus TaxID=193462 RepID=UPI0003C5F43F|nr:hypothetical protein [Streptomyces niveus]EST22786.1 hypothetical protein M877_28835 [Streptomyces niveus NCIMB 11891]